MLIGALFGLIFGLIRGNSEGWSSPQIVASLSAAAVLLVAFVIIEHRRDTAMLDLSLFRKPAFAGVSVVALTLSASMFAMFLYLTLYIQDVLGYGPLAAGARFLPLTEPCDVARACKPYTRGAALPALGERRPQPPQAERLPENIGVD